VGNYNTWIIPQTQILIVQRYHSEFALSIYHHKLWWIRVKSSLHNAFDQIIDLYLETNWQIDMLQSIQLSLNMVNYCMKIWNWIYFKYIE